MSKARNPPACVDVGGTIPRYDHKNGMTKDFIVSYFPDRPQSGCMNYIRNFMCIVTEPRARDKQYISPSSSTSQDGK